MLPAKLIKNTKKYFILIIAIILASWFIYNRSLQTSTFVNYNKEPSNVIIHRWHGTIDDHLVQVFNALLICLHFNHNLMIPKHDFMNQQYFKINPNISEDEKINQILDRLKKNKQFLYTRNNKMDPSTEKAFQNEENNKIAKYIIKKNWNKPIPPKDEKNNITVLHLRGSPRVWGTSEEGLEFPAPLSYYEKIIDSEQFKQIHLISEDRLNICIEPLLKKYKNVIIDNIDLPKEEQIELLLKAKTVIASHGNCMQGILLLSNNIQTLHRPIFNRNTVSLDPKHYDYHNHDLIFYAALMRKWKNTENDNKLVKTWKEDKIV